MPRQVLRSKLARAASTARSTPSAGASGTVARSSAVAGLTTSTQRSHTQSTRCPLMKSFSEGTFTV